MSHQSRMHALRRLSVPPLLMAALCIVLISSQVHAVSPVWATDGQVPTLTDGGWLRDGSTLYYTRTDQPLGSSFTIRSVFTAGSAPVNRLDAVHLVGLSSSPSHVPDVFRLVLARDTTGWGLTWTLRIESDEAFVDKMPPSGVLTRFSPMNSHIYEVMLSYDGDSGTLSLVVTEASEGRTLYRGSLDVSKWQGPLWPVVGAELQHDQAELEDLGITTLGTIDHFLPVSAQWHVLTAESGQLPLASTRIDSDESLIVRLTTPPIPGNAQFRLVVQGGSWASQIVFHHFEQLGEIELPSTGLPVGTLNLHMDYLVDDEVRISEHRQISVGHLDVRVGHLVPDRTSGTLSGTVRIESRMPLAGLPLLLVGTVNEWIWDDAAGAYKQLPFATHTLMEDALEDPQSQHMEIPFSILLPDKPGVWNLTINVQSDVSHTLRMDGGLQLFDTLDLGEGGSARSAETFRVCSYNVFGFDGWPKESAARQFGPVVTPERIDHFVDALGSLNCDVLAVQEGASFTWLDIIAQRLGVDVAKSSTRTSFPGGIFSRAPILMERDFSHGPPSHEVPFTRTAGAALLDVHGRKVWVVNIHAHPTEPAMRQREAELLADLVDEMFEVSRDMIVLGDFNSSVSQVIHEVLRARGFMNVMVLGADQLAPTVNHVQGGVRDVAIDHIYVSPGLLGKVRKAWVVMDPGFRMPDTPTPDDWVHSDHLPVVAELVW